MSRAAIKIYGASKLCHAQMWKDEALKHKSLHFVARWPYFVGQIPDDKDYARNFWQDDLADVARADVVLVYALPEDKLRGALIEAGAGLVLGKKVFLTGNHPDYGTWQHHPSVMSFKDLAHAIGVIKTLGLP